MPTCPLTQNDNFDTISTWLRTNLSQSYRAICSNTADVPTRKGVYCWFLKQTGYEKLSQYVRVFPVSPVFHHQHGENKIDLVYLGTAGTGKRGQSHLNERLKWHLCSQHSHSSVCSGTLSTLRATVGALISDDLILPDTTNRLNRLFEDYFIFGFIEYRQEEEVHIDNDEKVLISTLKPLLNFKNNADARRRAGETPSNICRKRRQQVYDSTRNRLNC